MAEASAAKGGAVGAITRKVGPLPLWAWAALLLVGYLAYTHLRGGGSSSSTGSTSDTTGTTEQSFVPGFDAAGAGGSGGIGAVGTSDAAGGQPTVPDPNPGSGGSGSPPSGGGGSLGETPPGSTGGGGTSGTPGPSGATSPAPHYFYNPPVAAPITSQVGAGGSRASSMVGLV